MRDADTVHSGFRFFMMMGVLLLFSTAAGCGLLGSGDGSEDDNFPDPPGRPNSSVQVMESQQASFAPALADAEGVPSSHLL